MLIFLQRKKILQKKKICKIAITLYTILKLVHQVLPFETVSHIVNQAKFNWKYEYVLMDMGQTTFDTECISASKVAKQCLTPLYWKIHILLQVLT